MSRSPTNQQRARFAKMAVAYMASLTGAQGEDDQTQVADLITNIEHHLRLTLGLTRRADRTTLVAVARRMADTEQREDLD